MTENKGLLFYVHAIQAANSNLKKIDQEIDSVLMDIKNDTEIPSKHTKRLYKLVHIDWVNARQKLNEAEQKLLAFVKSE